MTSLKRMETFKTKLEVEEMPNGKWQVREVHIYEYDDPLAARNKMESYIHREESEV